MSDAVDSAKRFPYVTVVATLLALLAFLGLSLWMYRAPNYLGEPRSEPKADPAEKLKNIREKNQAALEGKSGGAMSVSEATDRLLRDLKSDKDRLPFPTQEPPVPETKK